MDPRLLKQYLENIIPSDVRIYVIYSYIYYSKKKKLNETTIILIYDTSIKIYNDIQSNNEARTKKYNVHKIMKYLIKFITKYTNICNDNNLDELIVSIIENLYNIENSYTLVIIENMILRRLNILFDKLNIKINHRPKKQILL